MVMQQIEAKDPWAPHVRPEPLRQRRPPEPADRLEELPARFAPPPLGELLVLMGALTQEELQAALARQRRKFLKGKKPPPLGRILVESGVISQETIETALTTQKRKGGLAKQAWRTGIRLGALSAQSELDALKKELGEALSTVQSPLERQPLMEGYIAGGGSPQHWQMPLDGSAAGGTERPRVRRTGGCRPAIRCLRLVDRL